MFLDDPKHSCHTHTSYCFELDLALALSPFHGGCTEYLYEHCK
jgi:hypothetical protein